ncbi:MAG TPA: DUF4097 family beta strand repeat-containing protein [Candidatus Polarisedimenticolaceae bacterium]|nr:DUF4097 family beta strand repeat-containing protein [Candidatus Polarisedimenticolaceae bacterium]
MVACGWMLGSVPASVSAADPDWRKESLDWLEPIEPGGVVRVVNPLGDVHARFGGYEARVELLAVVQHDAARSAPPEVVIEHDGGGLRVAARGDAPGQRVDLVLFVPRGSPFDARTERGDIELKGLEGDVTLQSIEGDVTLRSVRGRVDAKTARGTLSAALEAGVTNDPQNLTTETGEIEVHLWDDANFTVRIETSGEISTDFSLEIEHLPFAEPGKLGRAVVGRGGPQLHLSSKRGRVRLLRLQRDFHPKPETGPDSTTRNR